MKSYSKKMLVGVSFASLMLGSFQGVSLAEDTKGASFLSKCAQNGASRCTTTSTRISSFIESARKQVF